MAGIEQDNGRVIRQSVSLYKRHWDFLQKEADLHYDGKISILLRRMSEWYEKHLQEEK